MTEHPPVQPSSERADEAHSRVLRRRVRVSGNPAVVVLRAYATEHAIYGTVLVSALVAVGWNDDTDLEVFLFTLGTVTVFWLAHVYASTVARLQTVEPDLRAVWGAVVHSARQSAGMILAMLLPSVFLLLATVGVLDEYVAYYIALWLGVAILVSLGYEMAAKNGRTLPVRMLGASLTGALGLGVIWLSTLVH